MHPTLISIGRADLPYRVIGDRQKMKLCELASAKRKRVKARNKSRISASAFLVDGDNQIDV